MIENHPIVMLVLPISIIIATGTSLLFIVLVTVIKVLLFSITMFSVISPNENSFHSTMQVRTHLKQNTIWYSGEKTTSLPVLLCCPWIRSPCSMCIEC